MTISTPELINIRIEGANADSPIAVFKTTDKNHYNAVFENTAVTKKLINSADKNLVGVYYGIAGVVDFKRYRTKSDLWKQALSLSR